MKIAYQAIRQAFLQCGIQLHDHENFSDFLSIPNSVTNRYIKVADISGNRYILRINGKLWQPFDRENESRYLRSLKQQGIQHNVLCEDVKHGFQICQFYPEESSFEKIPCKRDVDLAKISRGIRQYHQLEATDSYVSVPHMMDNAIGRTSAHCQTKFDSFGLLIKKMLLTLCCDVDNYVLSHNDLLPSNIYLNDSSTCFIDWEYAGKNHRVYDLAMLAIQSRLTPHQEKKLLSYYDQDDRWNTQYSFIKMKPVVSFLLLQWHLIRHPTQNASHLVLNVIAHIQEAMTQQLAKTLRFEHRIFFVASHASKASSLMKGPVMDSDESAKKASSLRLRN